MRERFARISSVILANRSRIGMPRIIQVSALGAHPDHPSLFLQTKAKADRLLLKEADSFVVRPSIVCTPETRLITHLRTLWKMSRWTLGRVPAPARLLDTRVQPISADDLAEIIAHLSAGADAPRVIEARGADRISIAEYFAMLPHSGSNPVRPWRMKGAWSDRIIQALAAAGIPSFIGSEEHTLLGRDNITDHKGGEALLGRPLRPTLEFWRRHLRFGDYSGA